MNFLELQTEVQDWINFTAGVSDQDFSTDQIKRAINQAYKREVRKGRQEGGSNWFRKNMPQTWAASTTTLTLSDIFNQTNLLWVEDVTDSDPGYQVSIGTDSFSNSEIFWLDNRTLQYGDSGPSTARTLRFHYMARPVDMVNDAEIPDLVPDDFHELLVLSAGVYLRYKADEMAPGEWKAALDEVRMDYWKEIALGRPRSTGQGVRRVDAQADYDAPAQDRSSISTDNNS